MLGYTQVISTNAVNDLHFGKQFTTIDEVNFFATPDLANAGTELGIPGFPSSPNPGVPNFGITGYDTIGGIGASVPLTQQDITWQGTDVFNWTHGAHSISTGAEIRKIITNRSANNNVRGSFSFTGQYAGDGGADFARDTGFDHHPRSSISGGSGRISQRIFCNGQMAGKPETDPDYGLRYELTTAPQSTTGNGTILDPTNTHFIPTTVPSKIPFNNTNYLNFAPRVGFAYRTTDKWVVRGGYGIYYNSNHLNDYTLTSTNPPFSTIYTFVGGTASSYALRSPIRFRRRFRVLPLTRRIHN